MAITWHDHGADNRNAMEDGFLVGQVVRYDQEPAWAAFIRGTRVGTGRVATREEAQALVEQAWAGRQRRRG